MLVLLQFMLDHLDLYLTGETVILAGGVHVKKLSDCEIEISVSGRTERWGLIPPGEPNPFAPCNPPPSP